MKIKETCRSSSQPPTLIEYAIVVAAVAIASALTLGVIFLVDKFVQTLLRLWLGS